ncbi:LysE family translocator [Gleimia sp. 6138-11-ORH1]|uniref:LysE family translocator n=1 Tax=Gleimia sp. 6138-11-ORH1 TaxID=2973937 RepID=UPI002168683A|nr:LysE family translocator [Gleimia sp. 6138-11-ORH1]MCS4484829.1 LysE family translocator [Gleimia sp. 6138-11-ORH1]
MLSTSMWVTLLGTFTIAVASPGPDFLLVLRTALHKGRAHGYATAVGIAAGTAVWITATMAGLATLLHTYPSLASFTRYAGAALLFYFGIRILVGIIKQVFFSEGAADPSYFSAETSGFSNGSNPTKPGSFKGTSSLKTSAILGFITTTVGNPKAAIFFSSLFATMLPAQLQLLPGFVLGLAMVLISFSWFVLVSSIAGNPRFIAWYERLQTPVDFVLGTLFIGLAVLLVWQ